MRINSSFYYHTNDCLFRFRDNLKLPNFLGTAWEEKPKWEKPKIFFCDFNTNVWKYGHVGEGLWNTDDVYTWNLIMIWNNMVPGIKKFCYGDLNSEPENR